MTKALELAKEFRWKMPYDVMQDWGDDAAAELRRLHQHELCNKEWLQKTDWVQETLQPMELGMHRADALKKRIERLQKVNEELLEAVTAIRNSAYMPPGLVEKIDGVVEKATTGVTKE